jgi:hypothetical protein
MLQNKTDCKRKKYNEFKNTHIPQHYHHKNSNQEFIATCNCKVNQDYHHHYHYQQQSLKYYDSFHGMHNTRCSEG